MTASAPSRARSKLAPSLPSCRSTSSALTSLSSASKKCFPERTGGGLSAFLASPSFPRPAAWTSFFATDSRRTGFTSQPSKCFSMASPKARRSERRELQHALAVRKISRQGREIADDLFAERAIENDEIEILGEHRRRAAPGRARHAFARPRPRDGGPDSRRQTAHRRRSGRAAPPAVARSRAAKTCRAPAGFRSRTAIPAVPSFRATACRPSVRQSGARSPAPGRFPRSAGSRSRRPVRNPGKSSRAATSRTPGPVSRIEKRSRPSAPEPTSSATPPLSVNLTALPTRLMRTCRNRPESPITSLGASLSTKLHISRPLSCARGANSSTAPSMRAGRSNSAGLSSSFPASRREKSRMSLMSDDRASPDARIAAR